MRRFGALYFLLFGGEVMIRINGVDIDKIEISLMQYIEENSISPQRIAVELNEKFCRRQITPLLFSKTEM